ncbi:hypothetical protein A6R68_14836, partial [Neotoma lepida]
NMVLELPDYRRCSSSGNQTSLCLKSHKDFSGEIGQFHKRNLITSLQTCIGKTNRNTVGNTRAKSRSEIKKEKDLQKTSRHTAEDEERKYKMN